MSSYDIKTTNCNEKLFGCHLHVVDSGLFTHKASCFDLCMDMEMILIV